MNSDLNPGSGDGIQSDDNPEQIAQPGDQQEEFLLQEVAFSPQMPHRSHFKDFLKPAVLQVEVCVLEKIFGLNRALLPTFQREFEVLLQMGDPDPEGKIEIRISGSPWYQMLAKKMICISTAKSIKKHYGGSEMLGPETMKYLERKNIHCHAFPSAMVMHRLDEAMSLLDIGPKTVQESVPKIM